MKEITKKAIIIGIIAAILVICDGVIAKLLNQTASFTWVAFVSWTVFFGESTKERCKAVMGYVIGFLIAVGIMRLGSFLSFIPISILGVSLGSVLATALGNFGCIELENIQRFFPISVSGMFVGIAMTFSGVGIGLLPNTLTDALMLLLIIVIYGILGLLCGWATLKFISKK